MIYTEEVNSVCGLLNIAKRKIIKKRLATPSSAPPPPHAAALDLRRKYIKIKHNDDDQPQKNKMMGTGSPWAIRK